MLTICSCRNHYNWEENLYKTPEAAMAKVFTDKYGEIPPEHRWSTITKKNISINLPKIKNGALMVFDSDPTEYLNEALLLAKFDIKEDFQSGSYSFDCPKGTKEVYVLVKTETKCSIPQKIILDSTSELEYSLSEMPDDNYWLSYKEMQYILTFEDLSIGIDLDYNDVVLGITHVSGQNTMKVRLWALGTTMYTYAYLGETPLFEGYELHEHLGVSKNKMANTFSPNNVFTIKEKKASKYYNLDLYPELEETFSVPDDYSLVEGVFDFAITTGPTNDPEDKEMKRIVMSEKPGEIPYALLIAEPDWEWPSEGTIIGAAYPRFKDWVANPSYYEWYKK